MVKSKVIIHRIKGEEFYGDLTVGDLMPLQTPKSEFYEVTLQSKLNYFNKPKKTKNPNNEGI